MNTKHNLQARTAVPRQHVSTAAFCPARLGKIVRPALALTFFLLFLATGAMADNDFGTGQDAPDNSGSAWSITSLPFTGSGENRDRHDTDQDWLKFELTQAGEVTIDLDEDSRDSDLLFPGMGNNGGTVTLPAGWYEVGVDCEEAGSWGWWTIPTEYTLSISVNYGVYWYRDADIDGYGDPGDSVQSGSQPSGYVDNDGDCDDTDPSIHEDAAEVCGDNIDNDCDGSTDENCTNWYRDADGDNYGDPGNMVSAQSRPSGYVSNNGDCDDTNAAIRPGVSESCDSIDNDCDGLTDEGCMIWYRDADGDGYGDPGDVSNATSPPSGYIAMGGDCDDTDPAVHPGVAEICDGIDNNCDGVTDEGCSIWYRDADGDNYGDPNDFTSGFFKPVGYVNDFSDCDDTDPAIHPGVAEVCDGVDNNCDGNTDEGCYAWYEDNDGDGFGDPGSAAIQSVTKPAGRASNNLDCDDSDAAISPAAQETCDSVDNDCDGTVDEGCVLWYQDADGDGYGIPGFFTTAIVRPVGYAANTTDCDDFNAAVYPGAPENCGDGVDSDCDGSDPPCDSWFHDADGDGFGDAADFMTAAGQPAGYVADNTDCDDTDAAIYPGAPETCGDGIDNNCDGQDPVCGTWYRDADGDGFGDAGDSTTATGQPAGYVADATDCDDTDAAVYPGAPEACGDGVDSDCDGNDPACGTWYRDADSDGYGDAGDSTLSAGQPAGYVADATDCDDSNAAVHPGAIETCGDGVDNNCDGQDPACGIWYRDADNDGYGDAGTSMTANGQPAGYVADATDCDDSNAAVHPDAIETCGDGVDSNCDGQDPACTTWYRDVDGDGFGDISTTKDAVGQPTGYVADNTDCDDTKANVHPGAAENCGDGVDNNCDGQDPACATWYRDADGDGYGDDSDSMTTAGRPAGYVADNTDCDDGNAAVYPGAAEICGDGLDNDCAGDGDAACGTWYRDVDGDGFGDAGSSVTAAVAPDGYVADATDCDDTDAAIYPGAPETCGDAVDNNCDGNTDEGCMTWYRDADADGFGDAGSPQTAVNQPEGYVADATDCDDTDAAIRPGAAEVCDGVDNDCDGNTDDGCNTWYRDVDGDGFGDAGTSVQAFGRPEGYVGDATDCDDTDAAIRPGAEEVCDSVDNNCDGSTDEGCMTWYRDADGDGFGDPGDTQTAAHGPVGYVPNGDDCDDADSAINPAAREVCDGKDNNCDGGTDEIGCGTWYPDVDGDGHGSDNPSTAVLSNERPAGYVWSNDDCEDNDPEIYTGAPEVCDGKDNNCDGNTDEGCSDCFDDNDGDGYGDPGVPCACGSCPSGAGVANGLDCNDGDPNIHPGAVHVCGDGNDNDCDGLWDWEEGCRDWWEDDDGDGYGDPADWVSSITQPAGHVTNGDDCNDDNPAVHPGAAEVCDGIDNNCNWQTDEGCDTWYQDSDGDNYGDVSVSVTSPVCPYGYVGDNTDCDDADNTVHPGAAEVCGDGIDNDCDGNTDDASCHACFEDLDGDGYGNPAISAPCGGPGVGVPNGLDCEDDEFDINPGVAEVCWDGIDNNCNGIQDETCNTWYLDADGDGFGSDDPADAVMGGNDRPDGYVWNNTDCDDGDPNVNPNAGEICDGIDNDCDGNTDVGCSDCFDDNDLDGYGDPSVPCVCGSCPSGAGVANGQDCNDNDPNIHPGAAEICDGIDNDCDNLWDWDEGCRDWYNDGDGDGFGDPGVWVNAMTPPAGYVSDSMDCDDTDAAVHPGAAEVCGDGIDNNCNWWVDENCNTWYRDADNDSFGDAGDTTTSQIQPLGYVSNDQDCDDTEAAIHPAAMEVCDGIDNNCDGNTDDGCNTWYIDYDGDGYGTTYDIQHAVNQPEGYVSACCDCVYDDPAIYPGAAEVCDGADNNCDGNTDEGCTTWYRDADGDAFGDAGDTRTAVDAPFGYVANSDDCDDADAAVHPAAMEVCDGVDNNCDGNTDEGCLTWHRDVDGDGYGSMLPADSVQAAAQPDGYVADSSDCDDADAAVYPGAAEVCDSVDNNCDGNTDEGCLTWYADTDGDGFGDAGSTGTAVNQPIGYVADNTDCDDTDATIYPGAPETCGDGVDSDCAGGDPACLIWYADTDGDGYGDFSAAAVDAEVRPDGYVADNTDCDDTDATIYPGAPEVCGDGVDSDCAGGDPACLTWYADYDRDGFGSTLDVKSAATQPDRYVADNTDCDDTDAAVYPGAPETCGDGTDSDCDGSDPACNTWYIDYDGDGYGTTYDIKYSVTQPDGYVSVCCDCVYDNKNIYPGAPETCGDGVDSDCDGSDPACSTWYRDADGDGYGDAGSTVQASVRPDGYVADNTDCDDSDATAYPGAPETCGDSTDSNCDGSDPACSTWYADADGDGYGNPGSSVPAGVQPDGYVADNTDCDDSDATIYPGAPETCGDSTDSNCDGGDPACSDWYRDADGDGYGDAGNTVSAGIRPDGYVADDTDCNDGAAAINPGAVEICDSIDNNCDGNTDEGCDVWYRDLDGDTYGNAADSIMSVVQPVGYVSDNLDCNDNNFDINPGVVEICDSIDNNCAGGVDEGCVPWYADDDNDTYGDPLDYVVDVDQPPGRVIDDNDCNDNDATVNPGAPEVCDGVVDENCNGSVDEGCIPWYVDADGDGYGDPDPANIVMAIVQPPGYVTDKTDCDDSNPAINPGALEVCDHADDENCNGVVDELCETFYHDADADGYGNPAVDIWDFAPPPSGFVDNDLDCNDSNSAINPAAAEICDYIDNDCDGNTDSGCQSWYRDADGDGFGDPAVDAWDFSPPTGYLADDQDCDDTNAAINPDATELCDGIDNNCDGIVDDLDALYYPDLDGDGFVEDDPASMPCEFVTGYPGYYFEDDVNDVDGDGLPDFDCDDDGTIDFDCDDDDANIFPCQSEICNGIDDDCNNAVDDGLPVNTYYFDNDNDGWGVAGTTKDACAKPEGFVPARDWDADGSSDWDCNDNDSGFHPGAFDPCDTPEDENCSGDNSDCTLEPVVCANLVNYPLETQVESADPLVEFIIDDSGSMAWEVIFPGQTDGKFYYRNRYNHIETVTDVYRNKYYNDGQYFYQCQCYTQNNLYYNPGVNYEPWPTHSDADPGNPRYYPTTSSTINLDGTFNGVINNAHWYVEYGTFADYNYANPNSAYDDLTGVYLVSMNAGSVEYYEVYYEPGSKYYGAVDDFDNNYYGFHSGSFLYQITNPANVPDPVKIIRSAADENQNFANWFKYYRTRQNTAKAAILKTIASTSGVYMGVHTLHGHNNVDISHTLMRSVDDYEGTIRGFVENVGASSGTPLRTALKDVGRYFSGSYGSLPSPLSASADGGDCQQMFAIVMTDGYYNGSSPNVGNTDEDGAGDFDGGIYADTYSNTLADVAMHYYENDLSALSDYVPTTETDLASHQHMVTFTISFGLTGTLDPDAYSMDMATATCATGVTCTAEAPCSCAPAWPNPQSSNYTIIDDLWHTAVNGRGKFLSANNSVQLADALEAILVEVSARSGSGASVAVNTQELEEGVTLYRGSYNSAGWTGDLKAYAIDYVTGDVYDTPLWSAADVLTNQTNWYDRNIFTYNGTGKVFANDELSTFQQNTLGSNDAEREDIIDYIKGDKSNDSNHGGTFRPRSLIMGDVCHSAPVHVGDTIYVGANDGMLHAFDDDDGSEKFAYIPSFVYAYGNLKSLADPNYEHKYYVDCTPYIYKGFTSNDASRLLIGGMGKGGKGYFALDVSSPDSFGASNVLWEFPTTVDDDMGYSYSRPAVVPHSIGNVVLFGNGYDSINAQAVLYALVLDGNGAISQTIKMTTSEGGPTVSSCNGLSTPLAADVDFDRKLDYVYAGDLQGNLWKFDLTSDTPGNWWSYYYNGTDADPEPLFRARDTGGNAQPITSRPAAMSHCLANRAGYIIVFGTGKFISVTDFDNTTAQSVYGVWDWADEWTMAGADIGDVRQSFLGTGNVTLAGGINLTLLGQSVLTDENGLFRKTTDFSLHDRPRAGQLAWFDGEEYADEQTLYDGGMYIGWRLDLPSGDGERVITEPIIRDGLALLVTMQPTDSPCKSGGFSYFMLVDACDGCIPDDPVLDVDGDDAVDADDEGWNRKELDDIYYTPPIIEGDDEAGAYFPIKEEIPPAATGVAYWRFLRVVRD